MKVFTFWEPKDKIPAYLKLCMETWTKFIPNAEVHVLDFKNIFDYIDVLKFGDKLFSGAFSLPQIADAFRAMLLEKHGGIWMDVDTILLKNDIEKYLDHDKDVMFFGREKTLSTHICFIHAKPGTELMKYWVNTSIKKINEYDDSMRDDKFWSYLGNSIVDPFIRNNPDKYKIVDVVKENCMPELELGPNSAPVYADYYFKKNFHLKDVNSSVILLHNSWSPEQFKQMSEEEFLSYDCTISNLLSEVLEKDVKKDKYFGDSCGNNNVLMRRKDGSVAAFPTINGLSVSFKGKGSTVELNEPVGEFDSVNIICGYNNHVSIGCSDSGILKSGLTILATENNNSCTIGKNFSCSNTKILLHDEENLSVTIGDDCTVNSGTELRPSDGYTIYSTDNKEVLNNGESIVIGNHVLIEKNVSVGKGTVLSDDTVVKAGSSVNGKFPESNICISGIPASTVMKTINWDRRRPDKFKGK